MAAIILCPLQNFKGLKIKYKYIKQPHEVVLGVFYMSVKFFIATWYLTRDIMCQTRNIYVISRNFDYKKWSHHTENHCGYLISLVSAETPSVKTI